jgi:hypothetical protein
MKHRDNFVFSLYLYFYDAAWDYVDRALYSLVTGSMSLAGELRGRGKMMLMLVLMHPAGVPFF